MCNNKLTKIIPSKPEAIDFTQQRPTDELNMSSQTERIKLHFDDAAKKFDNFIQNLIPNYNNMLEIVTAIIPFDEADDFEVIDLGCGTGTVLNQPFFVIRSDVQLGHRCALAGISEQQ